MRRTPGRSGHQTRNRSHLRCHSTLCCCHIEYEGDGSQKFPNQIKFCATYMPIYGSPRTTSISDTCSPAMPTQNAPEMRRDHVVLLQRNKFSYRTAPREMDHECTRNGQSPSKSRNTGRRCQPLTSANRADWTGGFAVRNAGCPNRHIDELART